MAKQMFYVTMKNCDDVCLLKTASLDWSDWMNTVYAMKLWNIYVTVKIFLSKPEDNLIDKPCNGFHDLRIVRFHTAVAVPSLFISLDCC